jgi:hypothetical protein
LCCRTFFGKHGCLLNEVLVDSYMNFDRYCERIVSVGEANNDRIHRYLGKFEGSEYLLTELNEGVQWRGEHIPIIIKKAMEEEKGRELPGLSPDELYRQFQRELHGLARIEAKRSGLSHQASPRDYIGNLYAFSPRREWEILSLLK